MKPITVKITGVSKDSSEEICLAFLKTERWSEFKGYSILPGIKQAHFETRTPDLIGSRIKVLNTDGSSHVEEVIEWDVTQRMALKFKEFTPPLSNFATHFVEVWEFKGSKSGTEISRSMTMYPKSLISWFILFPISRLMKKAFIMNSTPSSNG